MSITATLRAAEHGTQRAVTRARITAHHADLTAATLSITGGAAAVAVTGGAWESLTALGAATVATIADRKRVARQARQLATWRTIHADWRTACKRAGLLEPRNVPVRDSDGRWDLEEQPTPPRLLGLRSEPNRTILTVRPHRGQTRRAFEHPALAHTLDAHHATAETLPGGRVRVTLHLRAAATGTVKPGRLPAHPDLTALPVARDTVTNAAWRIALLGSHVLLAGNTRSGKSGWLWAIIRETAPAIRAGTVRWHVIDPKGGMELNPGSALFATFAHDTGANKAFAHEVNTLLDGLVHGMIDRADQLRAHGLRKLETPTKAMPLEVIVIDEILALRARMSAADAKTFDALLKQLLAMGAAVGYTVVVATQDVRKEAGLDAIRDLIPCRVCLRVADRQQVDMTLGAGAWAAGATADTIDFDTERGVAWVGSDRGDGFVRVRAEYVDDDAIRALRRDYKPRLDVETPQAPTARHSAAQAVSAIVETQPMSQVVEVRESAPDAPPLRIEAWEGGPKRTTTEALALLELLDAEGRDLPTAQELAAWAGCGVRWAQMRLKDHRDRASHERTAALVGRPLAAEPSGSTVRSPGANDTGVSESHDAPHSDTGDPAGVETLGALDWAGHDERRTA